MRVCMLAYTHYEFDNRVMRYAEALVQRGDHVDVVVVGFKGQIRKEVIRGVNVYRIQRRRSNEKMPLSYLLKILAFLFNSAFHTTLRHLRTKYDVIHVHSIPDFEVFAALVPKLLGAKCILDIHDIVPEFYVDKFGISKDTLIFRGLLAVEKLSARFADHVIPANDIWAERLISRSVPAEKCTVFLNYPDRARFNRNTDPPKNPGFLMMYPGTLGAHQGLDIAIRAMSAIKDKAPDTQLHIYGGGGNKESLMRLTSELGLDDNVKFRDVLPIQEIARVMASADLGIVPKRADSFGNEAFSTKILEFMSLGVPVLAADTAIDRYYFNDSQIFFFESGNEEELAKSVLHLIDNPDLRDSIARGGEACAAGFSWDKHKQRYFDLVDSLVDGGP